ncbi:MAG: FAD-binding protein [Gaiellales bacterium]|jgi:L-aspartate oxidase|nr:FAD-binding protein [Gaiellales bacterium]
MSDVLVIGSGGAGLAAAIAAHDSGARVTIATKLGVASCNTAKAQGGIQAAVGDDDSIETHFDDIMRSSHDTADPVLAHVLAEEGPATVRWLEELGVAFTREADGSLRIARCGGATRKRLLQVGDQTGFAIATALRSAVGERAIEVLDHAALVELAPSHVVLDRRGERVVLEPGAIILAAGGRCKRVAAETGELSTNGDGATGEVAELAVAAGCAERDHDSLQRHPTGAAWPEVLAGYAVPETTRAYGARLLNANGEQFVDELAPRDVVAEAIIRECDEGRGITTPDGRPAVHLDCSPVDPADAETSFPYMLRRFRKVGLDPLTDLLPVYPVLHYQNGGLVIDADGATTVPGIWAAGEITGGVHGRNRMMGNSLLEICVFGRRAGAAAARAGA